MVLAGGLTKDDQWRSSSNSFFLPVKVLSQMFRGKFLAQLKQYDRQNKFAFYGEAAVYKNHKAFQALLNQCYRKDWYCYTKRTFSGPAAVVKYLGQYTIANSRIVVMNEHTVTITVKDRQHNNQKKTLPLSGVEFIRRFLLHVLPKRFVKIRHYGLFANRNKKTKLERSRQLTNSPVRKAKLEGLKPADMILLLTGKDVRKCPICGKGNLVMLHFFARGASP